MILCVSLFVLFPVLVFSDNDDAHKEKCWAMCTTSWDRGNDECDAGFERCLKMWEGQDPYECGVDQSDCFGDNNDERSDCNYSCSTDPDFYDERAKR
jgi:hypothetical protein